MVEIGDVGRGSFQLPPFDLDSRDKDVFLELIQAAGRKGHLGLIIKINGQLCKIVASSINVEVKNRKARNTIQYTLQPPGKTPPYLLKPGKVLKSF